MEACRALRCEAAAATGGQPQLVRAEGCHEERRLLALHQTDVRLGTARQQVLAEEALVELPVGRQQSDADEPRVRPPLEALAVAVGAVLHDVAAVHPALLVHLPEDDGAAARGTDEVVVVDALQAVAADAQAAGDDVGEPLPENTPWRMAAHDVAHIQRLERRQGCGRCMLRRNRNTLFGPLVVAVVVRGFVVVAARVLVVALAHRVGHILVAVPGVHIAHEAFLLATVRTGELAGLMARQTLAL